jgi:hypothetical protein
MVVVVVAGACAGTAVANNSPPGSGYTFDRQWSCGLVYGASVQKCWFDGVLGYNSSFNHSWGWGSNDYDGGGTVPLQAEGRTGATLFFYGAGDNYTTACYYLSCNDQGVYLMGFAISHTEGANIRHTLYGHAKA